MAQVSIADLRKASELFFFWGGMGRGGLYKHPWIWCFFLQFFVLRILEISTSTTSICIIFLWKRLVTSWTSMNIRFALLTSRKSVQYWIYWNIYTWNLFVLYFWTEKNPPKQGPTTLPIQRRRHLGSRYIWYTNTYKNTFKYWAWPP